MKATSLIRMILWLHGCSQFWWFYSCLLLGWLSLVFHGFWWVISRNCMLLNIENLQNYFSAEWFTADLKAIVNITMTPLHFSMIFIAVQTSSVLLEMLGTAGLFFYFCGISIFMTLFVTIFVPETNGKLYSQKSV